MKNTKAKALLLALVLSCTVASTSMLAGCGEDNAGNKELTSAAASTESPETETPSAAVSSETAEASSAVSSDVESAVSDAVSSKTEASSSKAESSVVSSASSETSSATAEKITLETPTVTANTDYEYRNTALETTWNEIDGAESYTVMRKVADYKDGHWVYSEFETVAEGVTDTYYRDKDVEDGRRYCYRVKAVSKNGESKYSASAAQTKKQTAIVVGCSRALSMAETVFGLSVTGNDSTNNTDWPYIITKKNIPFKQGYEIQFVVEGGVDSIIYGNSSILMKACRNHFKNALPGTKVILWLGANDIYNSRRPEDTTALYSELAADYPKLDFCAIPVGGLYDPLSIENYTDLITNKKIKSFNKKLKKLVTAEKLKNLKYVEVFTDDDPTVFVNKRTGMTYHITKDNAYDGMHYIESTYRKILKAAIDNSKV